MTPRAEALAGALALARGVPIAVVGDVMIDEYVWGDTARISPDAPVPVVDVGRRSRSAGGAANVAINLAVGGASVRLVGATGLDEGGRALHALLDEHGIATTGLIGDGGRRTTTKTRVIARGQQLVRLDEEDRMPLSAEARARVFEALDAAVAGAKVVVVSDYAKGVVDRELVARAVGGGAPVIVDPKSSDFTRYAGCFAITPNTKEAAAASGRALETDDDVRGVADALRAACGATVVLITRGARGISLAQPHAAPHHVPARAREVFDVTGAGDTMIAYFALGLAGGADPESAAFLANAAAGVAVGKVGTSAVTPHETMLALDSESGSPAKLLDARQAQARAEHERSLGRKVVFTNGCFDLLHAGHIHLLEQARRLGDFLIVAVNSDASVRRLKGEDRPLVGEHDRMRLLAALDAVGCVVVFEEDTPQGLIRALRPDVLVKGGDYTPEAIVGADDVKRWGGTIATIPLVAGRSTSALLASIKKARAAD